MNFVGVIGPIVSYIVWKEKGVGAHFPDHFCIRPWTSLRTIEPCHAIAETIQVFSLTFESDPFCCCYCPG